MKKRARRYEIGLKDLTVELWSQFVLTYTATNQIRDGKQRNLRIEVADTLDNIKCVVRIMEAYVGAQSRQFRQSVSPYSLGRHSRSKFVAETANPGLYCLFVSK